MISVSAEITDAIPTPSRGWVLFDGDCQFCRRWVGRMEPILAPRGFVFLPLQTHWVRAFFHFPENQLLGEMRVLLRNGETYGGADAIIALARYVWWAWPLVALAKVPGVRHALRAAYRRVAARRHCLSGACSVPIQVQPSGQNREHTQKGQP
jgi:predicted DCC family thiol-disulfide oxidoreductase YuxK